MKHEKFLLPPLLTGQAIMIILLGLVLGGSLLDPDFFAKMAGIVVAIFVIEGLIAGAIGGWKLLPHLPCHTRMESMDGGDTWTIVEEKKR